MLYIYILYSASFDKYYIGYSENVKRRLFQHNNPIRNSFTSKFMPWELKASFEVGPERSNALKVEKFIKNQKSRVFNKKLISKHQDKVFIDSLILHILSKND